MGTPSAFISSTYLDLRDIRDMVGDYLTRRGFNVVMFERGGVFYDSNLPLDRSCYTEAASTHLFILLVGGRYGSPASDGGQRGKTYASVTRRELETAIEHGVPILVFVRTEVDVELRTYLANPKGLREKVAYTSVDDTQVFRLLEQIYQLRKNNPVFKYNNGSDIVSDLDSQLAGLIRTALDERKDKASTAKVAVNGFKLFFYRNQAELNQKQLAERAGLSSRVIERLEDVPIASDMMLGENLFQKADKEDVYKLEQALEFPGNLTVGQEDDFLSLYIHYYVTYKRGRPRMRRTAGDQLLMFQTRVLVLDFEGTLTLRQGEDLTTWERLWVSLGYSVNDSSELARQFFNGHISHAEWCQLTCERFAAKGVRKEHIADVAASLKLVPGSRKTLVQIRNSGISLFLISGSIRDIVRRVLGDLYELFDEVHANDLVFDGSGVLRKIRGTAYDFEGKADFIKSVISRQNVSPLEVLFVGNSLNDVWASNAGARTLCVNPHFTNPNDVRHWTYCIRSMKDFSEILPYVGELHR